MSEENRNIETGLNEGNRTEMETAVLNGQGIDSSKKGVVKYIILGGVIVLLLLALIVVAAWAGLFGSKKGTIKKALINTFLESSVAIGEAWQLSDYLSFVGTGQSTVEMELNIGGMGSIDVQMAKDKDRFGGNLSVGYLGSSIRVADYYLDDEELRLAVPMLGDSVYFIDRSTLNDDLDTLVEKGILDEESAEYLKALNTGSAGAAEHYSGMGTANEKLLQLVSGIYDKVEVEKIDSGAFLVNGQQRECKGYRVKVNHDQIADFYLGIRQICAEEPEYAEYMRGIIESGTGTSLTGEPGEDDSLDQTLQEVEDYFREENYDINADIYIYKDTVANMQINFAEDASVVWNVYGGSFPLENTEFIISVKSGESGMVEAFRLERGGSLEKDFYSVGYQFVLADDDISVDLQYWKNDGDFSIEIWDEDVSVTAQGNIDMAASGKKLVVDLDSVTYDEYEIFSGELTVSGEAGEIEKPEGNLVSLIDQLVEISDYGSYMNGFFGY